MTLGKNCWTSVEICLYQMSCFLKTTPTVDYLLLNIAIAVPPKTVKWVDGQFVLIILQLLITK